MATNRLYIANKETNEYVCIAKVMGDGWRLGNIDILKEFLGNTIEFGKTDLVIGTENDDGFYDTYIKDGTNINAENKWTYF